MTATRVADFQRRPRAGRLAGAAALLSVSFILSRLLGLVRTVAIANALGNSRTAEAYFAAFRIPDTMFTLVSGGALASAFIPVFAGLIGEQRELEAWRVASTVFNSVCLTLAGFALISFIFAPQIMGVLTGHYKPGEERLTVDLTRIMLLQPIFLGASALVTAALQSYHRFVLTAISPLVYNIAVIVGALMVHSHGVIGLGWSVVVGAVLQFVIQLPGLRHEVMRWYRRQMHWESREASEVLRLFVPRVVGLAAFQAMLFVTLYLAQGLPQGMVGAVNYSWLLISFPLGALGTAAATAIFPTLSQLSTSRDFDAVRRTVNLGLRFVLFLAIPSAAGLVVLRRPIVNLLYGHSMDRHATEQVAFALLFYALAVPALTAIEVLPRVFYAYKDTAAPVRIAVVSVALDAVLSIVFVHELPPTSGQGGLALATAISSTLQAMWLFRALQQRIGDLGTKSLGGMMRDTAMATFGMAVVTYVALDVLAAVVPQSGFGILLTVCVEIGIGAGVFVGIAYLLGAPELWIARSFLRRQ